MKMHQYRENFNRMENSVVIVEPKRKRAPNYTPDEQLLCLNIVKKYKSIVENKKANGIMWKEEEEAWNKIATEFNACSSVAIPRTTINLKKVIRNKKKDCKKYAANEKREMLLTGGGKIKTLTDPILETTLDIVNHKTVYGLKTRFGDGGNYVATLETVKVQSDEDYRPMDITYAKEHQDRQQLQAARKAKREEEEFLLKKEALKLGIDLKTVRKIKQFRNNLIEVVVGKSAVYIDL
ncbi:hypothetical protein FQA39_LY15660 [Lamprigera yunnana]|nr:hypothetical protein FQA39_LY15660 [Lamprigera yunnana]